MSSNNCAMKGYKDSKMRSLKLSINAEHKFMQNVFSLKIRAK